MAPVDYLKFHWVHSIRRIDFVDRSRVKVEIQTLNFKEMAFATLKNVLKIVNKALGRFQFGNQTNTTFSVASQFESHGQAQIAKNNGRQHCMQHCLLSSRKSFITSKFEAQSDKVVCKVKKFIIQ